MSESTDDDPSISASSFGNANKQLSPSAAASQSTERRSRSPSSPIRSSSFGASPIQRGGGNTSAGDVFDDADPCEKDVFGVSSRDSRLPPAEKQRRIHGTRVTATPEEISKLSALLCNQMPAELNNREVLSQHFSQFGRLEHVSCDLKRKFATIYFSDHTVGFQTTDINKSATAPGNWHFKGEIRRGHALGLVSDDRRAESVSWRRVTLKFRLGGRYQARTDEEARNYVRGQALISPTPSVTAIVSINSELQITTRKPPSNEHWS
ncbi:hypothetical protein HPB51_008743 [Rhipicephalus microplus]|uniref:RRM domain-containing protein n=1 Tax=Rhipicephalus microplus TaxID=6941 RepID=A0A9J6DFM3_RHIMP|nr:hypothetical protein HPB51_008743 [Rhipicephalus microplus]